MIVLKSYMHLLKNKWNKRGFTLIELLVVIAIIGILAVASVTGYIGVTRKAARSEAYSNLETLRLLEEQFFAENNRYTITLGNCAADNPGNVATIRTGGGDATNALPNFRPGTDLNFSYCIQQDMDINGAQPGCFTAEAYGNTNTRVDGDFFVIDCDNNRNF